MARAIRVTIPQGGSLSEIADDELGDGDILVDVEFSSVNFKDALALTGRPGVIKTDGTVAGIDFVGTVAESTSDAWLPGDRVVLNGWGAGESRHGGFSERARVPADWLVPVPDGLSSSQAAAIGTAGFTAMLAVLALEEHGVSGDILVTGATGGVGSIAIAVLGRLGYSVVAATGKPDEHEYLRGLGGTSIIGRAELESEGKPLQSQRWGGVIDSAGSTTLANALAQTNYGGMVASCGLAAGHDLPTTVMPFILRAVTLRGINSVFCPAPLREEAWRRLERDLDLDLLDSLTSSVPLAGALDVAAALMRGEARGRTVVDVQH